MEYVKLSDLKSWWHKVVEYSSECDTTDVFVDNEKKSFIKFIFWEIFRFWLLFSTILIFWIIFINFNIFYNSFKEVFFSYEIHALDINFNPIWDFSNNTISSLTWVDDNIKDNNNRPTNDSMSNFRDKAYRDALDSRIWEIWYLKWNSVNERNLEDYLKISLASYTVDFNLLPPGNRIIIPSIWVDAPIVDIPYISPDKMADADFDDELYQWVVKYPFTPNPDRDWNLMLFWHTSYYWWRNNPYWEVFARIPRLKDWDIVQIIWGWKLYEYEVFTTVVRWPNAVGAEYEKYREWWRFLTLMGCYPIWSDAQRILVMAKQIQR